MSALRQIVLVATTTLSAAAAGAATNESIFRDRIQPVLNKHCESCHGGKSRQSNLSLASLDSATQGGKRGPAIVPGKAGLSLMLAYIRGEKNPKMPLGGTLPDAVIADLAAAIDQMRPPENNATAAGSHREWLLRAPAVPPVPAVNKPDWVKNPIDAFILARLEAKGMTPAPPSAKRTLIRRLYFDLLGLPPPPDQIAEFLQDTSSGALERLVDRLLEDPRYGERWGRHWLDLVRFAESDGFAVDSERPTAWRYRDYVIRAFNRDKPYDEFIKEQLAGDEGVRGRRAAGNEPGEALLALGFLRMGPWEADANFDNQLRLDFLNEVTGTVSQVFFRPCTAASEIARIKFKKA